MVDRSLMHNIHLPPYELVMAPRADQCTLLDKLMHVSEPDPEAFADDFFIEQMPMPDY